MSVVGHQDFWVVGARFYYLRDPVGGVAQPTIDMGVIASVTPNVETEVLELEDADGGKKKLVDEALAKITESYDIQTNNMNQRNLAMLLYGTPPESFVQSAAEIDAAHTAYVGHLVKIVDGSGVNQFGLTTVAGVYTGTVQTGTLTDIVKSTKTLTITEDVSALSPGDFIIVNAAGLTNILNSKTYTVVSATYTTSTAVVVEEEPAADESSISGVLTYENAGTIYDPVADWTVVSLDRGLIRVETGSAIAAGTIQVIFSTGALTGDRLVYPQALTGDIKGAGLLVLGRSSNAEQTVREFRASITPNAANLTADDFSDMTFTVKVLTDTEKTVDPAGRLLYFKGTVPSTS